MNSSMQLRRPGVIAGVAISLLLHGVLIFGYRLTPPAAPVPPPAAAMTVWLQPPKPPELAAKVEPPPPLPPRKREKTGQPAARASQAAPATAQTITLPPASAAPATAPPPDPLHPEEPPKKFDMNAALGTARKLASEKGALQDPARAGTAVAQLDDHPLYPEQNTSELARKIDAAKRPDCKNGNGAGLLSPLIWLMDKKDHGCKW